MSRHLAAQAFRRKHGGGVAGLTYLSGFQFTNANGEVEFISIFHGWYNGRICHIHFQVFVSSSYAAISQFTFPIADKQAQYAANSDLYTSGAGPMSLTSDNVFSDGYQYQMATLTPHTATGDYESYFEVTVQVSGTAVIGHPEKENTRNFALGQNFQNPYTNQTTIPINLVQPADLILDLYDLQGKKQEQCRETIYLPVNKTLN
ncbi:MAG: hypothetical protein K1X61_02000 [Chitinophagales bacterium]|nr:hypothetical protein [Chitinophagales bacterium]